MVSSSVSEYHLPTYLVISTYFVNAPNIRYLYVCTIILFGLLYKMNNSVYNLPIFIFRYKNNFVDWKKVPKIVVWRWREPDNYKKLIASIFTSITRFQV